MSTLVIVEHNNQTMHSTTRHVVTAAKKLNADIILLVVGYQCQSVAQEAAQLAGVHSVWIADDPVYEHQLAENVCELVVKLASSCDTILASSSTYGKNLLPRIAACLDVGQISEVTSILDNNTFEHPIYAGNILETVRVLDQQRVLSIRATAFEMNRQTQPSCSVEPINQVIPLQRSHFINCQYSQSARPELTQAAIVVSGGRGVQQKEKFKLIEDLADVLGAAVGASRAAVDAGFVPNDYQVGQTGKVVAPKLYFAIGISGAIQHLAGMKDSKVIVAINKDEDAPIMKVATYRLVGDLFEIVPQLIALLKQRKSAS